MIIIIIKFLFEEYTLQNHRCENLKSYKFLFIYMLTKQPKGQLQSEHGWKEHIQSTNTRQFITFE
jgi:hypothetical protein